MHKRINRGFTIVELVVVIIVVGIIAAITMVIYNNVQVDSRDTKRANDMALVGSYLETYFEKNGSYPAGCGGSTCEETAWYGFQAPDIISAYTTSSQLATILSHPSLKVADPIAPNPQLPFVGPSYVISNDTPGYIYRGGQSILPSYVGNINQGINRLTEKGSSNFCVLSVRLASSPIGKDISSYVLGYYSESNHSWQLYMGKYGSRVAIESGATPGFCNIVN